MIRALSKFNIFVLRRYLLGLDVILILGVAFFCFKTYQEVTGLKAGYEIPESKFKVTKIDIQKKVQSYAYYKPIENRNLFDADPKINPKFGLDRLRAITSDMISKLPKAVIANFKLKGTIVVFPEKFSAAIIEQRGKSGQDLYYPGDAISAGVKLVKVLRNTVVIERNGREEVLSIYDPAMMQMLASARRPSLIYKENTFSRVAGSGEKEEPQLGDTWIVDRMEVKQAMNNMGEVFSEVKIRPNLSRTGQMEGFELINIKSGSFAAARGLLNGDIVKSINGEVIDSPQKAFEIYNRFKDENQFQVAVIRNGRLQILDYVIQ